MERTLLVAIFAVSVAVLITRRGFMDALIDAIQNFRGGPPGMHPMPADDKFLILRRHKRAAKFRQ